MRDDWPRSATSRVDVIVGVPSQEEVDSEHANWLSPALCRMPIGEATALGGNKELNNKWWTLVIGFVPLILRPELDDSCVVCGIRLSSVGCG